MMKVDIQSSFSEEQQSGYSFNSTMREQYLAQVDQKNGNIGRSISDPRQMSHPQPEVRSTSNENNVDNQKSGSGALSELPLPYSPEAHRIFLEVMYKITSESFRGSQQRVDAILGVEISNAFQIELKASTGDESLLALQFRWTPGASGQSPEEYERKLNRAVQAGSDKLEIRLNQKFAGTVAQGQQAIALREFLTDSALLVDRGVSLHQQSGTLNENSVARLREILTKSFDVARQKFADMPSEEQTAFLNALRGSPLIGLFQENGESTAPFAQKVLENLISGRR